MNKAIIIQNKFIGDVLIVSLIAKNLKEIYPKIEIHLFCYRPAVSILKNNPYIDKVIDFDDTELKNIATLLSYTKKIRSENYDILIDSYAKLQSRFITLCSRAKMKISYDKPYFKHIYTNVYKRLETPVSQSFCTAVDDRLSLLSAFVDDFRKLKHFKPDIYFEKQDLDYAKSQMRKAGVDFNKKILMFGVVGSETGKTYPIQYMAELLNFVIEYYNVQILFNYTPKQGKIIHELLSMIPNKRPIFNTIIGNSVFEFAAIMSFCDGIISNEGGAVNIAKALRKPTFAIFSPHKFRKDWGCFENESKHQSVHLKDYEPEIYQSTSLKMLLNKPLPFYLKLRPKYFLPKVDAFITDFIAKPIKKRDFETQKSIKPKISALLITLNEEDNIKGYIENFSFADEIIIIDSYSTDKTKEIAESYDNVTFLERKFDNFSAQKSYAIEQSSYEWLMFFDADERVSEDLKQKIIQTVEDPNHLDAYFIRRSFYIDGKKLNHSGLRNDKAIRLFRKSCNRYDSAKFVHETIICEGKVGELPIKLDHYFFKSIEDYQRKLALYSRLRAKRLYKENLKPNFFHFVIKPGFRFLHHYLFGLGFLDGKYGFLIAKMHAKSVYQRYVFLKEFQKQK